MQAISLTKNLNWLARLMTHHYSNSLPAVLLTCTVLFGVRYDVGV